MQEVRAQTFPKNPKPRHCIKPLLYAVEIKYSNKIFRNYFDFQILKTLPNHISHFHLDKKLICHF